MHYAGQYSVREAFEGSTVLITGATGQLYSHLASAAGASSNNNQCITVDAGYIGGLVLEQLLRVGHIGKVCFDCVIQDMGSCTATRHSQSSRGHAA